MIDGLSNSFGDLSPFYPVYGDGGPDADSTISYDGTSGGFGRPSPGEVEAPDEELFSPLLEGGHSSQTERERELEEALARKSTEALHLASTVSHLESVVKAQKEPPLDLDDIEDCSDGSAPPFGVVGIFAEACDAPLKKLATESQRFLHHIASGNEELFVFYSPTLLFMLELLSLLQKPIRCKTCKHWLVGKSYGWRCAPSRSTAIGTCDPLD